MLVWCGDLSACTSRIDVQRVSHLAGGGFCRVDCGD